MTSTSQPHSHALVPSHMQVVVDAFEPNILVSDCATKVFDFATMKEDELHDISIPLNLTVGECALQPPCRL